MWYILDNNNIPVQSTVNDFVIWEEKFPEKKTLKQENVGDVFISTVFLGLDHSFNSNELLLWETMIFGGDNDNYQERYSTYEDALAGHETALDLVKKQGNTVV